MKPDRLTRAPAVSKQPVEHAHIFWILVRVADRLVDLGGPGPGRLSLKIYQDAGPVLGEYTRASDSS